MGDRGRGQKDLWMVAQTTQRHRPAIVSGIDSRFRIEPFVFCLSSLSLSFRALHWNLKSSSTRRQRPTSNRWTKYRPIKFDSQTMCCQLNHVTWQWSIEMRQFTPTEIILDEMETTNDAFTRFNHIKWLSFGHRMKSNKIKCANEHAQMVGILKLINQLRIAIILNKIIKSPQSPSWNYYILVLHPPLHPFCVHLEMNNEKLSLNNPYVRSSLHYNGDWSVAIIF